MDERLLVVIVNYRLAGHIDELLATGVLAGLHVLLVDNGSEPDLVEGIGCRYGTDVLLLEQNVGFAGAVNRAMVHAGAQREVLLLNPDVRLTTGVVESLRAALAEGGLTAVSPLLVGTTGKPQVGTAGGPVSAGSVAVYFLFLSHFLTRWRGAFYTGAQLRSGLEPAWVCMACLLLKGNAFVRFGPIPEHELVYAEDLAWGVAATAAGARFGVLTDVMVVHEGGAAGASREWSGAVARYLIREYGLLAGGAASACMWTGLVVRGLAGRTVSLPPMRVRWRKPAPTGKR